MRKGHRADRRVGVKLKPGPKPKPAGHVSEAERAQRERIATAAAALETGTWPSHERVADATGLSVSTVRRHGSALNPARRAWCAAAGRPHPHWRDPDAPIEITGAAVPVAECGESVRAALYQRAGPPPSDGEAADGDRSRASAPVPAAVGSAGGTDANADLLARAETAETRASLAERRVERLHAEGKRKDALIAGLKADLAGQRDLVERLCRGLRPAGRTYAIADAEFKPSSTGSAAVA